jgi:cellulose synthase/poly-beta-1,6-N-acetylglucosamine synthase-like glycosyltransferase
LATNVSGRELTTVIIPARNEERFIASCLDSVLAQDEAHIEVVVVDGSSDDRTAEIVGEYAARDDRVRLLHNPERIIPVSLNLALEQAKGTWLVRIDAHATVPRDYVGRAVTHLESGRWGGVGGRKDGVGVTPAGRAIAASMGSKFGVGNSTYHHGTDLQTVEHVPFGAYPVALARELGGWDETLRVNQDFEFDHRVRTAGHEILFDPALRIQWHCRQSVPDLFRQYSRYGRGKVVVALLHPESVSVRHVAAPAVVVSWAVAAGLAIRRPRLASAVVAPYTLALAAASAMTARQLTGWRERAWVAPAYVAMHAGWGVGAWHGLLATWARRARRTDRPAGPIRRRPASGSPHR